MQVLNNFFGRAVPRIQKGFTLIELIITVAMMAILLAIALPSYRRYMVLNAESQAQAKMKQLSLELETWRGKNLIYKGFKPKTISAEGTIIYAYNSKKTIQVPDASHPIYTITLESGSGADLNEAGVTDINSYNSWRMLATPQGDIEKYGAKHILLTSTGLSCLSKDKSLTITANCVATGTVAW